MALLTAGMLCAATRTLDNAWDIARQLVVKQTPARGTAAEKCEDRVLRVTDAYYALRANGCFVVVAADETQPEVLGYSMNGAFDEDHFPPALEAWLNLYTQAPVYHETVSDACAPIVPCQWNQRKPYNILVPLYNATNHCVSGCTATAMAQLMYTYRHPVKGVGSASYYWDCPFDAAQSRTLSADFGNTVYDWNNMLPSYNNAHTAVQDTAVATLVYHCGVAIGVVYGISASSGTDYAVLSGLFNYFGYDHNIRLLPKAYYAMDYIAEELRDELRAGRPVYVSGQGAGGGHAFLCDGFTESGYFHFNWGWGGLGDGDYLLTGLNPTQQGAGANQLGDYNTDVVFATGIRPATGSIDTICQLSVGNVEMTSASVALNQNTKVQLQMVRNYGLHAFGGTYGVGLLAEDGETLVCELTNPYRISNPLLPTYYFTSPLTFQISFPSTLAEGTYFLCGLYRNQGETEPHVMQEYGGAHVAKVKVNGGLVVSAKEEKESAVELAVDSVTCNVKQAQRTGSIKLTAHRLINVGSETFSGNIGVVLVNDSRNAIHSVLAQVAQLITLQYNYYITSPLTVTFTIPSSVEDGDYYLTFAHHQVQCQWKPVQRHPNSDGNVLIKVHIQGGQISLTPVSGSVDVANELVYVPDEPMEVYTLTGLRISKEQMSPSQVYIIRQGGKTIKVKH